MERLKNWFQNWKEGLRNTYRLVVMNDNTFEEVGSYRLTQLNIYVLASSIFVILVCLVTMVIAFTSLKEYIPGYGDVNLKDQADRLERKVEAIEDELVARELYIERIQKVLTGGVDTTSYAKDDNDFDHMDTSSVGEPIPEDYAIRAEIERSDMQSIGDVALSVVSSDEGSLEGLHFYSPVKGAVISDEFQPKKDHYGIDLLGPKNTPIISTLGGIVILADYTYETGYVIGVQHSHNLLSFYKHNSKLLKKVGDRVSPGEALAVIGNTGELSDGPHLHFELWYKSKPVNPREYMIF